MTLNADLHCHTTASDGSMGPLELYQRATDQGVELLAITDHDSVEAHRYLAKKELQGPRLITGMELSTTWSNMEIHIVGLNFPLDHPDLDMIIQHQNEARKQRSLLIAGKLVKQLKLSKTAEELYQEVVELALNRQKDTSDDFQLSKEHIQTGRPHFAWWLIEQGYVKEMQPAFDKYLSHTKLGNLRAFWPPMSKAIAWIRAVNGQAVLAHPGKYSMTRTKLRALVRDFSIAGGAALEVSGCNQPPGQKEELAELCLDFNLQGSRASDFHTPKNPWVELGKPHPLPEQITPVWQDW
ncbi:phosphatase [Endozoicomonas sp. OPT23]|uniref:PHP domain-containing protein n=1 Tax=Endozoicomonas sp. OPT23 TaxID=2072845 RepID=UPI00129A6C79|nr:PHP domain-containing protein [Endozoicomonas sp. OPT23]MRI34598.1 phosphatase [Endozoicomonas sp. OPT23]